MRKIIVTFFLFAVFVGRLSCVPRWAYIAGGAGVCGVSSLVCWSVSKSASELQKLLDDSIKKMESDSSDELFLKVSDLKSQVKTKKISNIFLCFLLWSAEVLRPFTQAWRFAIVG